MKVTYKELQRLSDKEIIEKIERLEGSVSYGTGFLYEEIRYRQNSRLTRYILWLTVVVTVATLVNVGLFLVG